MVYTHNKILSPSDYEWNIAACNNIDTRNLMLNEKGQSQKKIQAVWYHAYEAQMQTKLNKMLSKHICNLFKARKL